MIILPRQALDKHRGETHSLLEQKNRFLLYLRGQVDGQGTPIAMQLASLLVQEEFFLLRRQGTLPEYEAGELARSLARDVDCQMGLSFTLALSLEIRISSWPVIDTCLSR
jgi:hypothetical protein